MANTDNDDDNIQTYFSHFSPVSIYHTITSAASRLKSRYDIPSINPFYYLDPRVIRAWLSQPENFRNLVRVIVVVAVYLLMRQRVDVWLRRMGGAPEGKAEVVKRRLEERMRKEREAEGGGRKGDVVDKETSTKEKGSAQLEECGGGGGGSEAKKNK